MNGKLIFNVYIAKTMNSAKSTVTGSYSLKLKDGTEYEFSWPNMEIKSLMSSPTCIFSEDQIWRSHSF